MHNVRHLSRIYPKGTRVDSSNYSPVCMYICMNVCEDIDIIMVGKQPV